MPGGLERLRQTFGTDAQGGPAVQFGGDDLGRLEAQMALFQTAEGKSGRSGSKSWPNPRTKTCRSRSSKTSGSQGAGPQHARFADAKGQNMDTKLPSLPAERCRRRWAIRDVQAGTSLTGTGEGNALSRTTMTIEQSTSGRHSAQPSRAGSRKQNGGVLPWNVGTVANMVKPSADFVQDATQSAMPLKAGISGHHVPLHDGEPRCWGGSGDGPPGGDVAAHRHRRRTASTRSPQRRRASRPRLPATIPACPTRRRAPDSASSS